MEITTTTWNHNDEKVSDILDKAFDDACELKYWFGEYDHGETRNYGGNAEALSNIEFYLRKLNTAMNEVRRLL